MKTVGIIVNTPAQVHFYRNIIKQLEHKGITSHVVARDYGETVPLLEELNIEHFVYSSPSSSKMDKIVSMPFDVMRATRWFRKFNIDLVMGFGVYDVYVSTLLRVPNLIFNDSEPMINAWSYALEFKLFMPFVDHIITPSYFRQDLGKKHIRIDSLKEMAYLHPSYYTPDESILDLLSVSSDEPYSLLRFNAFDAVHDMGVGGFTDDDKIELVRRLEDFSTVFISSEKDIPPELRAHAIKIPKSRIHDALYYADLFVTDTQTMATESALLATPTVRCNSFVGSKDMGNFIELERNYGLISNFSDPSKAIDRAGELIRNKGSKEVWRTRRANLLNDYVDITALMTWIIENYPHSLNGLIDGSEIQGRFRFNPPSPIIPST